MFCNPSNSLITNQATFTDAIPITNVYLSSTSV